MRTYDAHGTRPIVFKRDIALIQHPNRLYPSKDLTEITNLAQDRESWVGTSITDGESCRSVMDEELGSNTAVSQVYQIMWPLPQSFIELMLIPFNNFFYAKSALEDLQPVQKLNVSGLHRMMRIKTGGSKITLY